MPTNRLLLVDDDPLIRDSLGFLLSEEFDVQLAETRVGALQSLNGSESSPALALVDLGLPPTPHDPAEGFALVRALLQRDPAMRILILSGQSDRENVRHAMSLGAADFIPKPCEPELLKSRLRHQLLLHGAVTEQPDQAGDVLEGASPAMQGLRARIDQFAKADFPVLVEGESGTGKELVASQLHKLSDRAERPYIAINCAAFSNESLASQLFGHAQGAFAGATHEHKGFFESAGSGTLFLDQISEMSVELQSNLLRVIENGEYFSVGESTPRVANARLIAASNKDLASEVYDGRFRQDLYYRLSVLSIKTPPLRERGSDRLALLGHFQRVYSGKVAPFTLDDEAREAWLNYRFPGNVRELRNIVIRLGTRYPGEIVGAEQLLEEFEHQLQADYADSPEHFDRMCRALQQDDFHLDNHIQLIEWEYIQTALDLTGGNLSKSARLLNVNRTTLYSKIQRLEDKFG